MARVGALIGDPARANILTALLAGQALTASELAQEAGITPATASGHLAQLVAGSLIAACRQGRHKYFTLSGPEAAQLLEAMMGFAGGHGQLLRTRPGPRDHSLRHARVCYDHLAGETGVQLYDSLVGRGFLGFGQAGSGQTGSGQADAGLGLTAAGAAFCGGLGIDIANLRSGRRPVCRECLDWSARRPHLAGALGQALFELMRDEGWIHRETGSRAVRFLAGGQARFDAAFPPPGQAGRPRIARSSA